MATCAVILALVLALASSELMLDGNSQGRIHCHRITVGWYYYRVRDCETDLQVPEHYDDGSP